MGRPEVHAFNLEGFGYIFFQINFLFPIQNFRAICVSGDLDLYFSFFTPG
jgi:hypothetical protein